MKIICSTKIPSTSAKVKVMILCLAFGIVSCKNQNINSLKTRTTIKAKSNLIKVNISCWVYMFCSIYTVIYILDT